MKTSFDHNYKIAFDEIAWKQGGKGVRHKAFEQNQQRIRLVEFNEEFVEVDWCTTGHIGFVLAGELKIDFSGNEVFYKKGDGIFIPPGESNKHKAIIAKGNIALLLLIESLAS